MRVWMWLGVAAASIAWAQSPPDELLVLTGRAGLDRPVAAWCRGEFQPGRAAAFAVAITASTGGGRYLVLDQDRTVVDLAPFSGGPDLACYSRAEADRLNATIGRSLTIHGEIAPRWNTTVVCGFVDNTTATCWQRSPTNGVFVRIGGWVT
jgi:hypothetical protein